MGKDGLPNRWAMAIGGTLLMICLGTVYAWSFFQKLLMDAYGWTNSAVALTFSLAICALGLAAAWGGIKLAKIGPTKLAAGGGALFGVGYLISALALYLKFIPLLYIGYGAIGGAGLGLAYVTPVATIAKWFPDKKGFATGMVVMGFGFGALLMSLVFAPFLMAFTNNDLVMVFAILGLVFLVITIPLGLLLKNPPAGYMPAGYTPPQTDKTSTSTEGGGELTVKIALLSKDFVLMWLIFFCNITAGIAIISFQSPLFQDLWNKVSPELDVKTLASYGALLIAISSLLNGIGRFLWGGLSDKVGRANAFRLLLGTQILVFVVLMFAGNPWIFAIMICYVLLCYGGGFGTMPAFVLDMFGAKLMAVIYGIILTAWSAAGIVGPQIVAIMKDNFPADKYPGRASFYSFIAGAIFLCTGLILSFFIKEKKKA